MKTIKLSIELFLAFAVTVLISSVVAIAVSASGFDAASVYVGGTLIAFGVISAIARFLRETRTLQQNS